ncbi:MAG: cystathionine gamma-synthase family protein [Brevundimonas sp.]|jgi:methionine-gamma-lyase|uniref:cystathionine gamma-synthase family protein n=1 Tax=Brevundimonas sp. TaxID=1871086 RepID=UPI002ABAD5C3|nr:cystathionine gamma-synthase family protein [Brevundimonas sp.]MDZ4108622.1 cystathionine gamma-synthase family protein [Brevundimonas sp.]
MSHHKSRTLAGRDLAPETLMMGFGYDPTLSEGAIKAPLFQTSTFVFKSAEDGKRFFEVAYGLREKEPDEALGLIYSRINNPNLEILEDRLAVWDKADRALVFSSGMAAISTAMLALTRPGDTVLYAAPAYGGTEYLFDRILPRYGVKVVQVLATGGTEVLKQAIRDTAAKAAEGGGRLAVVYLETPSNPTNQVVDIAAAVAEAHGLGQAERPVVAVDNTFLGPLWQRPLELGADLSLYSLTKYVGGHSDLIAGGCLGSAEVMARIAEMRTICGTATDPHTAWLLSRSLETLHLRMERSQDNARVLSERLRAHDKVTDVLVAGGGAGEQRAIFEAQCQGPGSTFSIRLKGGEAEAFRMLNALRLFKLAVSLGGSESLASHPSSMTHSDYSTEAKGRCGIGDDLIRLSVGVENVEDLWVDLEQALAAV